jgi:hypothetical protein
LISSAYGISPELQEAHAAAISTQQIASTMRRTAVEEAIPEKSI